MTKSLDRVLELHAALNGEPARSGPGGMAEPTGAAQQESTARQERNVGACCSGTPGQPVLLPEPRLDLPMPLTTALWERRSRYAFDDRPLVQEDLSTLLRLAVGVGRRVQAYGQEDYPLGLAASGGGLRSLTTYVLVSKAAGLEPGVYFYEWRSHALRPVDCLDPRPQLAEAYVQPEFAERAPVALAMVGHLDVALAKYPPRHYRTLHIDAGIAAENIYLVAEALGLAGCAVAGFHDAALSSLLCLRRPSIPILLFPIGHRTP